MSLLTAEGATKTFQPRGSLFRRRRAPFVAVDDVSFTLEQGETLAIVGESGAGKSTTGRLVLRLIEPDAGSVSFDGVDLIGLDAPALRAKRKDMQMVFQDPYSCMDPRIAVGISVAEPLRTHFPMTKAERAAASLEALQRVGLGEQHLSVLPHELSGGQLQRVAIARALTLNPKLIVCDEPVAALDVSVRAQVLGLLVDLQKEFGISYIFVSHDLGVVEAFADRIAVMRAGRIVEIGPTADVFANPQHEYTQELLAAIPSITQPRVGADKSI